MLNCGRVGDCGAGASGLDEGPSAISPEFPGDWEHEDTRVVAKVRLNVTGVKRIGARNDEGSNVLPAKATKALGLECKSVRTHESLAARAGASSGV
jgi:hypothetical protein